MIVEFIDLPGQKFHDRFQDWRREHQTRRNACFLAFHGKNKAFLHAVDCWHTGSIDWDGYRVKGNKKWLFSLTKNRKVCADSLNQLLSWAAQENISVSRCSHCCEALSDVSHVPSCPSVNIAPDKSDGSLSSIAALEISTQEKPLVIPLPIPEGNHNPQLAVVRAPQFQRDTRVKEWVLQQANGKCESCEKPSPFNGVDGLPYLEVHHVRHMANGGSDIPANTVALCPNCHRELHYGADAKAMANRLYERIARLVRE